VSSAVEPPEQFLPPGKESVTEQEIGLFTTLEAGKARASCFDTWKRMA